MSLDDGRRDLVEVVLDPGYGGDSSRPAQFGRSPAGFPVRERVGGGGEAREGEELTWLRAGLGRAEPGDVVADPDDWFGRRVRGRGDPGEQPDRGQERPRRRAAPAGSKHGGSGFGSSSATDEEGFSELKVGFAVLHPNRV